MSGTPNGKKQREPLTQINVRISDKTRFEKLSEADGRSVQADEFKVLLDEICTSRELDPATMKPLRCASIGTGAAPACQ